MDDDVPPVPRPPTVSPLPRDAAYAEARRRLFAETPGTARRIGRFQVLRKIGEGGMGVVWSAYDDELDRRVAIKLIAAADNDGVAARTRREAQAMAKLSHPNVVPVYDVGTHEGRLFIAMEFVKGRTLRQWTQASPRSPLAIIAMYAQAARGLQAAHEAGLVHRDFKPDNVVVGEDGRARVLDFGLVRRDVEATDTLMETELPRPRSAEMDERLTDAGTTMGTPAYMAPEQFLGEPVDARTDQFSFCVALYEALGGERPFVGADRWSLEANVTAGKLRPWPDAIPAWVRGPLLRGLAVEPTDRHPSMSALVEALEGGRRRIRRRRLGVAAVGLGLAGATALAVPRIAEAQRARACAVEGASIEAVWNDGARQRLRTALLATHSGHAATTADKVMPWLDDHARAWQEAQTQACLVAAPWEERAAWCLDEGRMELEALLVELSRPDATTVTRAVEAVASLRDVEPCVDADLLERLPAPPSDRRGAVRRASALLSRSRALAATGAVDEGLAAARQGLAAAEEIGWPRQVAAARWRVGALLSATGAPTHAEAVLEDAYFEASEAGASEEAFHAALSLADNVGRELARPAAGERWWKLAEVVRARLPDRSGLREATSLGTLGNIALAGGTYERARQLHARAVELTEAAVGADHPALADALTGLASDEYALGNYTESRALHERALAITTSVLGADHPDVALALGNLAVLHVQLGDADRALQLHRDALAIREKSLGPDHPLVAANLANIGNILVSRAAYAEAETVYRRALGIHERVLGPDHPEAAVALLGLADCHRGVGEYDEAAAQFERAVAVAEKALGPEHGQVAFFLYGWAGVERHRRAYDDAAALYERARAIWERSLGAEHPQVAWALVGLGEIALARGRAAEGLAVAERALAIDEAAPGRASDLAIARFLVARALAASDADRPRAITLARQARDVFAAEEGVGPRERLADATRFLADHGG